MKKLTLLVFIILISSGVLLAQHPAPSGLDFTLLSWNSVELTWNEPVMPFDGYEDFEGGIIPPDFTVYDVNGGSTWGILGDGNGYNSDKCIACLYESSVAPNDDWFVSPPLAVTGTSQFNFWAGNFDASYGEEEFNVLINTTGPDPTNFVDNPVLYYKFDAGSVYWDEFTVDLSGYAGQTIWIAIQCISDYMWYLKVDDYTVTDMADGKGDFHLLANEKTHNQVTSTFVYPSDVPRDQISENVKIVDSPRILGRDLLGYNVFRDNFQINPATITFRTYLDEGLAAGTYEYYVTAVYTDGESDPSNTVEVTITPVSDCDEGFETGDFSQFPWYSTNDVPWFITDVLPFYGTYSAQSGVITDNEFTDLNLDLNLTAAGDVSFALRTSSEEGWDFLEFYIDGTLIDSWSGIYDWIYPATNTYPITEGAHTLSWQYMKDTGAAAGDDCAWIDNISFPDYVAFGSLSGTVSDDTGSPLENALVSLNDAQYTALSGVDGSYEFPVLNAGTYSVVASKEYFADYTGSTGIVSDQNTTLNITLYPLQNVSVTGMVEDQWGSPIADADVKLEGDYSYATTTNASGEFTINDVVSNNTYTLSIFTAAYDWYSGEVIVGSSNVDVGTIILDELIIPVSDVQADLNTSDEAEISWVEPGVNIPDEMRHDDGTYYNVMSFTVSSYPDHMFGSAFRYKCIVEQLRWWLSDGNSGGHPTIQLQVYGLLPDGSPNSNDLIYDTGWITNVDNEWNTFTLPEALYITDGFLVGLRVNTGFGTYVVFDDGYPETYPGSFPYTTIYPGELGNAWGNSNTFNAGGWFDFDYDGRPCNIMVRATGLVIDTVAVVPSETNNSTKPEGLFIGSDAEITENNTNQFKPVPHDNDPARDLLGYDVYRIAAGDEMFEDLWVKIESNIQTTSCVDEDVSTLPAGLYRYAIRVIYSDGKLSVPKFSYFIVWEMFATATINVNTPDGGSTAGAHIRIFGTDGLAALYNENYKDEFIEDNNSLILDLWKQQYTIYVDLLGYEQHVQENVYVYGPTTVDILLNDQSVPASHVEADTVNTYNVDITWQPAVLEILWDQYHHEGCTSTRVFQDFLDAGWKPFNSEGAFDIVLTETSEITRLDFEIYNDDDYYDPIPLHFAIYDDYNSAPRDNWTDSVTTQGGEPNQFWEYQIELDPTVTLEPGTHWLGVSAMVPIIPDYSVVGFRRRFTLGNGTEMYYRMPGDGYGMGWADWLPISEVDTNPGHEVCARVMGRTPTTPRSVIGYDVYRLHPGEEDQPNLWVELATGITDLNFLDDQITVSDYYKYAIIALFPNDITSDAAFSNELYVTAYGVDPNPNFTTNLFGSFPNPFIANTNIQFSIAKQQEVSIEIYNILGQHVKTLVNTTMNAGIHDIVWDARDESNKKVVNGIYFYRMTTKNFNSTKKLVLFGS
ncbi:MAG: carboxypeptidase regulatory-like domain-containing protein [Candidatus Celaenobacter antarcticus]|nr:carboxypeptidase regulatory-like domain-containing protein [Candidatus Celaenobacter antarcticus]